MNFRLLLTLTLLVNSPVFCGEASLVPEAPFRIVEWYVPREAFLKLAAKQPDGVIMEYAEYRALSSLGAGRKSESPEREFPAETSSTLSATYEGTAHKTGVRWQGKLKVTTAQDGWSLLDLGTGLNALGEMKVDGATGWGVLKAQRLYVLLNGSGSHEIQLNFSTPITKVEDSEGIDSAWIPAAASLVRLNISGPAVLAEAPGPWNTQLDTQRDLTQFSGGFSSSLSSSLKLRWKSGRSSERPKPALLAEENISYYLDSGPVRWSWNAKVNIQRAKAEEMEFVLPAQFQVLHLTGTSLHSWRVENNRLKVLFIQPVSEFTELNGQGILQGEEKAEAILQAPYVIDAARDLRHIGIFTAPDLRAAIRASSQAVEVPPASKPLQDRSPQWLFRLEQPDSSVTASTTKKPQRWRYDAALSTKLNPKNPWLRAKFQVQAEEGSLHSVVLKIPEAWTLGPLKDSMRSAESGLQLEALSETGITAKGPERWNLRLSAPLAAGNAWEFEVVLLPRNPDWLKGTWYNRMEKLETPELEGAAQSAARIALLETQGLQIWASKGEGWRVEEPADGTRLALNQSFSGINWIAENTTAPYLNLSMERLKPRGEYEMVTHVLALEKEVWVRSDLRLTAVDQALDELELELPAHAKEPIAILGAGVAEHLAGKTPNIWKIRFEQGWRGARALRIEYRTPYVFQPNDAQGSLDIPAPKLEAAFTGTRRIVLQSADVVGVDLGSTPNLVPAALDDTPAFAQPLTGGRVIRAYRVLPETGVIAGSLKTQIFDRHRTLKGLVRELQLSTQTGPSGISRTRATFLLSHGREQFLNVWVPGRLLNVSVEGTPVQPLILPSSSSAPAQADAQPYIAIPLPPHSAAWVDLVYEQKSAPWNSKALWSEQGPRLIEPDSGGESLPIGQTRWTVNFPDDMRLLNLSSNLDPELPLPPSYFVDSFWRLIFSGRWPHFSAWNSPLVFPGATPESWTQRSNSSQATRDSGSRGKALTALEKNTTSQNSGDLIAEPLSIPEGQAIVLTKIGGAPEVSMSLARTSHVLFITRLVFLISALGALSLRKLFSRRVFGIVLFVGIWGLTLIPPALGWASPLFAVPFTEGLVCALMIGGVLELLRWMGARLGFVAAEPQKVLASLVLLSITIGSGTLHGGEVDAVYIPYDPAVKSGNGSKVFVPRKLLESWEARSHGGWVPKEGRLFDLNELSPQQPLWPASRNVIPDAMYVGPSEMRSLKAPIESASGWPKDFSAWSTVSWSSGDASPILTFTFQSAEKVNRLRFLMPSRPERFQSYMIESSEDGKTFEPLINRLQMACRGVQDLSFTPRTIKILRIKPGLDSNRAPRFEAAGLEVWSAAPKLDWAWGPAQYEFKTTADGYRAEGTLRVQIFPGKEWVRVPLDFGTARINAIEVDGKTASAFTDETSDRLYLALLPPPPVALKSREHVIRVELRGTLENAAGFGSIHTRLSGGSGIKARLKLPPGWEADLKSLPPGAEEIKNADSSMYEMDLLTEPGDAATASASLPFDPIWRTRDPATQITTRLNAWSYTHLELEQDGAVVNWFGLLSIEGHETTRFSFLVRGTWSIIQVTAPGLAEWHETNAGNTRRIELQFHKPMRDLRIEARGWQPLLNEEIVPPGFDPEGATRHEGWVALKHASGRRFTQRSLDTLPRAVTAEAAGRFPMIRQREPDRLHSFLESPGQTRVSAEMETGVPLYQTRVAGLLTSRELTVAVRTKVLTQGAVLWTHTVALPAGWRVQAVQAPGFLDWQELADGGSSKLQLRFSEALRPDTEILWKAVYTLKTPLSEQPAALELSQPRTQRAGKFQEILDWTLAAENGVELSQDASSKALAVPLQMEGAPGPELQYRYSFRTQRADQLLSVQASYRPGIVRAQAASFYQFQEKEWLVGTRWNVSIENGERSFMEVVLPAGAHFINAHSPGLAQVDTTLDGKITHVKLTWRGFCPTRTVFDFQYTLPLTIEATNPGGPSGYVLGNETLNTPGLINPDRFVALWKPINSPLRVLDKTGLEPEPDLEKFTFIPYGVELGQLAATFSGKGDWKLSVELPEVRYGGEGELEVSLARLLSVLMPDGRVRTSAVYTVRNRGRSFMRLALPAGSKTWGVLAGGLPVTASREKTASRELLQIPLPRQGTADLPVEIITVYEEAGPALPAAWVDFSPHAPELIDVQPVETLWRVFIPNDYAVSRKEGSVREVTRSVIAGGRLKVSSDEVERLIKLAEVPDDKRLQQQAMRNLYTARQELDDHYSDLERENTRYDARERARFEAQDLREQLSTNAATQQRASELRQRLKAKEKEIEAALAAGTDDPAGRLMLSSIWFWSGRWRTGNKASAQTIEQTRSAGPSLFSKNAFPSLPNESGALWDDVAFTLNPITATALKTSDTTLDTLNGGAVDLEIATGGTEYTFRRVDGHPTLTLSLRSSAQSWRASYWILLLVSISASIWWMRKRG